MSNDAEKTPEQYVIEIQQRVAEELGKEEGRFVSYRPSFCHLAGSVLAGILLSRIRHWWHINKEREFYKFNAPCKHKLYREGDSWQEEVGFSRSEHETAMKRIGTKVTKGMDKSELMKPFDETGELRDVSYIVLYWTDKNRVTWYWFNNTLLQAHTALALSDKLPNAGIPHYLVMLKSRITYKMQESRITYNQLDSAQNQSQKQKDSSLSENGIPQTEVEAPEDPVNDIMSVDGFIAETNREKKIAALLHCYEEATQTLKWKSKKGGIYAVPAMRSMAGVLVDAGIRPNDIHFFARHCRKEQYMPDTPSLEYIADRIMAFVKSKLETEAKGDVMRGLRTYDTRLVPIDEQGNPLPVSDKPYTPYDPNEPLEIVNPIQARNTELLAAALAFMMDANNQHKDMTNAEAILAALQSGSLNEELPEEYYHLLQEASHDR